METRKLTTKAPDKGRIHPSTVCEEQCADPEKKLSPVADACIRVKNETESLAKALEELRARLQPIRSGNCAKSVGDPVDKAPEPGLSHLTAALLDHAVVIKFLHQGVRDLIDELEI